MHYHLEIVMPPTTNIAKVVQEIMEPFSENNPDTEKTFWDFYVIGGRWAGTKQMAKYDQTKLDAFYEALQNKKITVSGLQCGKQELQPASQIPIVDELWNSFFPTENGEITPCPIFAHSNNQYDSNDLLGCDINRLDEMPDIKIERIIFANLNQDLTTYEAELMLITSTWTGCNFINTEWDGKFSSAIKIYTEHIKHYTLEHYKKYEPKDNWICVTIDYHS